MLSKKLNTNHIFTLITFPHVWHLSEFSKSKCSQASRSFKVVSDLIVSTKDLRQFVQGLLFIIDTHLKEEIHIKYDFVEIFAKTSVALI